VSRVLQDLTTTLVPLVMTAIGFQLRLRLRPTVLAPLGFGLGLKLIVAPLTVLLLCRLAGLNGMAANVSVIQAGMPSMVLAGALAIAAGMDAELSAALIGFGIFLSFGTLPLIFWLL
jgi:predicted permease